jgi:hypothetical protein
LFICLWPAKPVLRTRGNSGAALSQKVGAGARVTRGSPEAAPNLPRTRRRELRGHVAAPELL